MISAANPTKYTDIDQAAIFVEQTEIDALAVAIANSHGCYKGKPNLDFERLRAIRDAAKIPLVLHGGSGISEADFRKAISPRDYQDQLLHRDVRSCTTHHGRVYQHNWNAIQ